MFLYVYIHSSIHILNFFNIKQSGKSLPKDVEQAILFTQCYDVESIPFKIRSSTSWFSCEVLLMQLVKKAKANWIKWKLSFPKDNSLRRNAKRIKNCSDLIKINEVAG